MSIFGPGYGESIVLHLGNGQWMIVDSCLELDSGKPAPLNYLHSIGVDVTQSVRLIVATHWHDDHVKGISAVFAACKSARFVMSQALSRDDFLKLVALYETGFYPGNSGVDEFVRVFQILRERKRAGTRISSPELAVSNKQIDSLDVAVSTGATRADVFSLSPSSSSVLQAALSFSKLNLHKGRTRVPSVTPNHASVVLWIEVSANRLLLGADLENTGDPESGWSAILNNSPAVHGTAGVFKVPHHGAETAHEPCVWTDLLSPHPYALLTPFCRGDIILPSQPDALRITNLTRNAYVTAFPASRSYKPSNKIVRETMRQVTRSVRNVSCGSGQIRLRRKIADPGASWGVELFGDAHALA